MHRPRPAALRLVVCLCVALTGCAARESDLERARRVLAEGRDQEAYELATALTEGEGARDAAAWILLSNAARRTWRTSAAHDAAVRAVEIAPGNPRSHLALAVAEKARARLAEATAAARAAVDLAPEDADAHLALGTMLLGRKNVATPDYPAAEAELRRAASLRPGDPRIQSTLALALVESGQHAEGKALLDTVLAARPFDGPSFLLRGKAHLRMREFQAAADDLMQATALDPHSGETLFALARAFHLLGNTKDAETARARYRWVSSTEGGIEGLALRYHTEPENPLSAQELAQALLAARRYHEAFSLARTLSLDHPRRPAGLLYLGEAALGIGDAAAAVEAARRAVEAMPRNAEAQFLAARAFAAAGETGRAIEAAWVALELDAGNPDLLTVLGEQLLAGGKAQEAADRFDEVLRKDATRPSAVAGRGMAAAALGRPADADAMLTRALQARPRRADWLVARGNARRALGRLPGAEQDFRLAIRFAPWEPEAYGALAELLRAAGHATEAEEMERTHKEKEKLAADTAAAEEAVRRTPRAEDAVRRLAALYREAGRDMDALLLEERVLEAEA